MYKRVAVAIAGLGVVLLVLGGVGLAVLGGAAGFEEYAWYGSGLLLSVPSLALGLVVAARRPGNPVGALLAFVGFAIAFVPSVETYTDGARVHPEQLPLPALVIVLSQGMWMMMYLPVALLMLYFPDGRTPGPRWRWVPVALVAVFVGFVVLAGMDPEPYPPPDQDAPHALGTAPPAVMLFGLLLLPGFLGLLIASATAMVLKFRRAAGDPVRRAQVKWLAVAALWLPLSLLLCWTSYLLFDIPDLAMIGLYGLFITIPLATAIALLRHDLYDIDKAISTAVTYSVLTAALLGVYTGMSFLGGLLLGRGSAVAAAAATAACAAALTPVRGRLQRAVDARMYPLRREALAAIEELRRRTHSGEAEPEQLEAVLQAALRDPRLRVAYRVPGARALVDAAGEEFVVADGQVTPILLSGQEIGALIRGSVGSAQLLREVAAAAALLVEVVRLRIELGGALREVESSRSRLLAAGYRERRRLERDLHDGAQQRLVSLGMALRLAQRHLGDGEGHGGVDVDGLLDQAVAELGTAVAELRGIAHGLRPSSLDDGLDVALRTLAGSLSLPVTLEVAVDAVADDVATTAYYVVSEAVTNVVKHAEAKWIGLRVTGGAAQLDVRVSDDGRGGALVRPGSGLAGLADRVAAAGGALRVESPAGRGTVIQAVLPCAS